MFMCRQYPLPVCWLTAVQDQQQIRQQCCSRFFITKEKTEINKQKLNDNFISNENTSDLSK